MRNNPVFLTLNRAFNDASDELVHIGVDGSYDYLRDRAYDLGLTKLVNDAELTTQVLKVLRICFGDEDVDQLAKEVL